MKIWKRLLIQALAILAGASVSGQSGQARQEQDPEKNGKQEQSPQAKTPQVKDQQQKVPQEQVSPQKVPQKNGQERAAQKQTSQEKSAADFRKLDASALPITQKIQINSDADWLGIGFESI